MKYLIIGGSAAGLSAAQRIKELDINSEVNILSEEKILPYGKMSLPYLLSGELGQEKDLFLKVPEGVKLLLGKKVVSVKTEEKLVETAGGETFDYDKLLIATGAHPYIPEVEKKGLPLVLTIRNLEDINRLKERTKNSTEKRVILSGAGLVNCEIADALSKLGISSVFIIRSNRILSQILDEEGSKIIGDLARKKGIELMTGESIEMIEDGGSVVNVLLESGKFLKGSCVVFGKGVRPSLDFLKDATIKIGRGILTDNYLQTSVKDIYAAGDVTENKDLVYNDTRMHALWPVALEQGRIAGSNMAGCMIEYSEEVSRNILTLFGKSIFTGGISKEDKFEVYKESLEGQYKKIIIREGKLVGFVFIGNVDSPGVYLSIMKKGLDISSNRNTVLKGSLNSSMFYPSVRGITF